MNSKAVEIGPLKKVKSSKGMLGRLVGMLMCAFGLDGFDYKVVSLKFMKTIPILTVLFFATFTSCFVHTRKPKSDLKTETKTIYKIDERIIVENIYISKIDTTLNLFKEESLIGITIKGTIKTVIDPELKTKYYFDKVDFIETIENYGRQITIEIIPFLKQTNPNLKKDKPARTNVKYKQLADKTEFELYCEKKIMTSGMGKYQVDFLCGQQKQTLTLIRRK